MSHAIHRFIFSQCHLHIQVGVKHRLGEWRHECHERMAYLQLPLAKGGWSSSTNQKTRNMGILDGHSALSSGLSATGSDWL